MSRFRPARASPPLKHAPAVPAVVLAHDLLNESRSSTVSVPELTGLTSEEVDFIDAVIERAPATATTFLTVFKAYNDILQERGLDPQNEVVYYGKLLKLGTLRGKNWGEKWEAIKRQEGYGPSSGGGSGRTTRVARTTPASSRIATRLSTGLKKDKPEDTLTLHSHLDDIDSVLAEPVSASAITIPSYLDTPRPVHRPSSPSFTPTAPNSLGLQMEFPSMQSNARHAPRSSSIRPPLWNDNASEVTGMTAVSSSTIPPSYGAAVRESASFRYGGFGTPRPQSKIAPGRAVSPSPISRLTTPRQETIRTEERRKSVINEDDAWLKIREAQDIKEADRFREERLVERCWEVWKQGYQWIITTNEQISQARDTLILRLAFSRWRHRCTTNRELHQKVSVLDNTRRLKFALNLWKDKYKEKKQADWRDSMRARMKTVRERREAKLMKDAWAKWRQSFRSHLSEQHYSERLAIRFFGHWKKRLMQLDELDAAAEHFIYSCEERYIEKCWDVWRRGVDLRKMEKAMTQQVSLRIVGQAVDVWRNRLQQHRVADEFYDIAVLKSALKSWKAARDRIRALERRASKHVARQDDVLTRAVLRVWKAHERGRLLERVRTTRLLKQAWAIWKRRIRNQKGLEDLALAFSMRSSSTLTSSLQSWHEVFVSHRNAQSFAIHYHSAQLQYKMLLTWRLQLRTKLRLAKQAKIAQKLFVQKRFSNKWRMALKQKQLGSKLQGFETRLIQQYFLEWLQLAEQQRRRKVAAEIIQQRVNMRIMTNALTYWTNRVVDIKDRELQVSQKKDGKILSSAFKKWKALCIRHVEELSLMESYQDVKREENMRRMFYRWLTAARHARHRRLYLQQKEDELKLTFAAAAWDKWRERFQDIRLQPLADGFLAQRQKNLMFRAFGIWHSKTRSLPAVRFHAYHAKLKAWQIWRNTMPRALRAKRAREFNRQSVISRVFNKWQKAYKTKIELKAVARARYLRLPTAAPRQVLDHSRPTQQTVRPLFLSRPVRSPSPTEPATSARSAPALSRTHLARGGIASLLNRRSVSPERPKLSTRGGSTTRPASPTNSQSSLGLHTRNKNPSRTGAFGSTASAGDIGRSTLWQELRGIQLRSRPLSDISRSKDPIDERPD
ncbi:uncharacterized protein FIBRA_01165 [Fibroporia radiculosa]|uniref:Sfi1 spindle body domain-containing protein n=1 Tax=Fibroporia radiculosa TaxID=599839 RepID=J4GJG7_9APHY|nr:uncharacterized protein FIBRA_01165 [Fibroporia radiculosa]CCL99150.1 predicted protein [Fibroporia radiculosa]